MHTRQITCATEKRTTYKVEKEGEEGKDSLLWDKNRTYSHSSKPQVTLFKLC